jgi:hypothetical protein
MRERGDPNALPRAAGWGQQPHHDCATANPHHDAYIHIFLYRALCIVVYKQAKVAQGQ